MNAPAAADLDENPQQQLARARHGGRRWLWLTGLLFGVPALLVALLPLALEWLLEERLRIDLADRAEILDIDFNPFTGRLRVAGVDTGYTGARLLESGEFRAEIGWRELFDDELHVVAVELRNAVLVLRVDEQGQWSVGRIRLGGGPAEPGAGAAEADGWYFALDEARLDNVTVEVQGPGWQDVLTVTRARLRDLGNRNPETPVGLELSGLVDETPFTLSGQFTPFAAVPSARGRLVLETLPLARLDWVAGLLAAQGIALDLRAALALDYAVDLGAAVTVDLDGSLELDQLALRADGLEQGLERFAWNGKIGLALDDSGVRNVLEGRFQIDGMRMLQPADGRELRAGSVRWKGRMESLQGAGDSVRASHAGSGLVAGLEWRSPGNRFGADQVEWRGEYLLEGAGGRVALRADGAVDGRGLGLSLDAPRLELAAARLGWQAEATSASFGADGYTLHHPGRLELDAVSASGDFGRLAALPSLRWEGALDVAEAGGGLRGAGQLRLERLQLTLAEALGAVAVELAGLDWQGEATLPGAADGGGPGARGDLGLATLRLAPAGGELPWLDGRALQARGLVAEPAGQLSLQRLDTGGLRFLSAADGPAWAETAALRLRGLGLGADGAASVREAVLDGVRLRGDAAGSPFLELQQLRAGRLARGADAALAVGSLDLDGLVVRLAREADGSLPLPRLPQSAGGPDAATAPPTETAGARPLAWSLGLLRVGEGSRVLFADRAVEPAYQADLWLERLQLSDLGSAPGTPPGRLELEARIGEYTRLALQGALQPLPAGVSLELAGRLSELDLPPLSPYTLTHLGHRISSGQLSAELQLQSDGESLAGEQQLTLLKTGFEAVPSAALERFQEQVGMPLDAALALLQDKQGNIQLKLPVSGRLDDPQFDLGDAISQALGKATKTALVGVLKLALQPYGAILTAVELAGDLAANVRLDPLRFEPGVEALPEAAPDYLAKLHALLQERPGIQLRVCGQAVGADRVALQAAAQAAATPAAGKQAADTGAQPPDGQAVEAGEAQPAGKGATASAPPPPAEIGDPELEVLAAARAAAVKRALVEAGVPSARLVTCQPALDRAEDAVPRVELLL